MSKTKSIRVRQMHEHDLEIVLCWRNHPEVRKNMLSQHEISMDEHKAWFERSKKNATRALLIIEEGDLMIGYVGFSNVSKLGTADWGFLAAPQSPRGTGKNVCGAALNFAFDELHVHKVAGQVLDFNQASIRMHQSLGFTQEGLLREHHLAQGKHNGLVVFGLLASEWRARS